MKNLFIPKLAYASVEKFTSNIGMVLRKQLIPVLLRLARRFNSYDVKVEHYPLLEKSKPYIFASNHVFKDDIENILYCLDRQAYTLSGSQASLERDPSLYGLWLTGIIPILLSDKASRKSAIPKMARVLRNGNSVLIFPEGSFNASENQIVKEFYHGTYNLHILTNVPIVPIAIFHEVGSRFISIDFMNPIYLHEYDYIQGTQFLRDTIASAHYEQIEKYASRVKRSDLGSNPRMDFLKFNRNKNIGICAEKENWKDEVITRKSELKKARIEIKEALLNAKITMRNHMHILPIIKNLCVDDRYDLQKYMEDTADEYRAYLERNIT